MREGKIIYKNRKKGRKSMFRSGGWSLLGFWRLPCSLKAVHRGSRIKIFFFLPKIFSTVFFIYFWSLKNLDPDPDSQKDYIWI
jgi:hypothetical protein